MGYISAGAYAQRIKRTLLKLHFVTHVANHGCTVFVVLSIFKIIVTLKCRATVDIIVMFKHGIIVGTNVTLEDGGHLRVSSRWRVVVVVRVCTQRVCMSMIDRVIVCSIVVTGQVTVRYAHVHRAVVELLGHRVWAVNSDWWRFRHRVS